MIISCCPPPDTHSRVILKSQDEDDFLLTYINANYLKVSENMCLYAKFYSKRRLCLQPCDLIVFSVSSSKSVEKDDTR